MSITATISWMLLKVTFLRSLLPKYAPAIAAIVAEIKSVKFSLPNWTFWNDGEISSIEKVIKSNAMTSFTGVISNDLPQSSYCNNVGNIAI